MAYKVTITWSPTTAQSAIEQLAETIGGRFDLEKSYVQKEVFKDTPYYSEAPDGTLGTGSSEADENTMHKGVLLAFKQAIENDEHSIVLTGIKRLTALYFEELSYAMGEQGFIITVEESSEHPTEITYIDKFENLGEVVVHTKEGDMKLIRFSEDYFPVGSPVLQMTMKVNGEEMDVSKSTVTQISDSTYVLDAGLFMITDADGSHVEIDDMITDFPSGGMWITEEAFEMFSQTPGLSISAEEIAVTSFNVTHLPNKLTLYQGAEFYYGGFECDVTYSDGTSATLDHYEGVQFEPKQYTPCEQIGDVTVTASYGGFSSTFNVTVTPRQFVQNDKFCKFHYKDIEEGYPYAGYYTDGFTLTESLPPDWSTNYTKYFTRTGTGESQANAYYYAPNPQEESAPEWVPDTYYSSDELYLRVNDTYGYFKALDYPIDNTQEFNPFTIVANYEKLVDGAYVVSLTKDIQTDYTAFNILGLGLPVVININTPNTTISIQLEPEVTVNVTFPETGIYFYCQPATAGSVTHIGAGDRVQVDWENNYIDLKRKADYTVGGYDVTAYMPMLTPDTLGENQFYTNISDDALISSEYDGYYVIIFKRTRQRTYDVLQIPAWDKRTIVDVTADSGWRYHNYPYTYIKDGDAGFITAVDGTEISMDDEHASQYDTIEDKGTYLREDSNYDVYAQSLVRVPTQQVIANMSFDISTATKQVFSDTSGHSYDFYKLSDNFIPMDVSVSSYSHPVFTLTHSDNSTTQISGYYSCYVESHERISNVVSSNSTGINESEIFVISLGNHGGTYGRYVHFTYSTGAVVYLSCPVSGTYIVGPANSLADVVSVAPSNAFNNQPTQYLAIQQSYIDFIYDDNGDIAFVGDDESSAFDIQTETYNVKLNNTIYSNIPSTNITRTKYRNTEKLTIPVIDVANGNTLITTLTVINALDYYFEFDGNSYKSSVLGTFVDKANLDTYSVIWVQSDPIS